VGPVAFSVEMMVLIALSIGRLGNPLVLGYVVLVGYVLLGVLEGWEPRSEECREQGASEDGVSARERRGDSDPARTDG
jgi:hypothetical protein